MVEKWCSQTKFSYRNLFAFKRFSCLTGCTHLNAIIRLVESKLYRAKGKNKKSLQGAAAKVFLSMTLRLVYVSKCLIMPVLDNPYTENPTQRWQTGLKNNGNSFLNCNYFPTWIKPITFRETTEAAMVFFCKLRKGF